MIHIGNTYTYGLVSIKRKPDLMGLWVMRKVEKHNSTTLFFHILTY